MLSAANSFFDKTSVHLLEAQLMINGMREGPLPQKPAAEFRNLQVPSIW